MTGTGDHTAYRVSVICSGNICRSPMAEVILRSMVEAAGLGERVRVDSAGIGDWHVGDPADPRTLTALQEHGYDGSAHRAQQVTERWLAEHDLVLVADLGHREALEELARPGDAEVRLLREFDPEAVAARTLETDDPYFGDAQGFDRCLREVEAACQGLVDHLAAELAGAGRS
jgi:protein-tyrosine phosphatase